MRFTENEIKYTIQNAKSRQVVQWLTYKCNRVREFSKQTVSSIYYDTWGWKSLNEKINGDYLKKKVRLRWYSDLAYRRHDPSSFAEAKFRIGTKRHKVRVPTPHHGEWITNTALSHPTFLEIPALLTANGVMLGNRYFPVYQISYKRVRFQEPLTKTTVCFDYDICASRTNALMLPHSRPFVLPTAVLEIKGALDEMPALLKPLVEMGCKKESFSKYYACYEQITAC